MSTTKQLRLFISSLTWMLIFACSVKAQPTLQKDFSYLIEIPSIVAMESSPAHLYVLSDTEGMVVFRTRPDSLQWLYSSTGMERRGNTMTADIRFAYLFGNSRRLTVLEPTSVLGVYSSTFLPDNPRDAERVHNNLYVAMGDNGLGRISLQTPASVDSTVTLIEQSRLSNEVVMDLESSPGQLFVLADGGSLFVFNKNQEGIRFENEIELSRPLTRIFVAETVLLGSDASGTIYEIDASGNLAQMGSIGEPIVKMEQWNDWLLIKGSSSRIWTSYRNQAPQLWKDDSDAGNLFTVTEGQLWLSEYNQISRVLTVNRSQPGMSQTAASAGDQLRLENIPDVIVPYPRPVLLSLNLEEDYQGGEVHFAYQAANIESATIRGNGFYWQPQASDIGTHNFRIIATTSDGRSDSTSFNVNVRSFNAPPRFTPIRPVTIPVGQPFVLPVNANDPDGMRPDLIRYLGVDMPDGASIDETTGEFEWTPTARQAGTTRFQVIATDQYGAASQTEIVITAAEISRGVGPVPQN